MVEVERGEHLGDEFGVYMQGKCVFIEDGGVLVIMAVSSLSCLIEVTAIKKITFMERGVREQVARGSKGDLARAESAIQATKGFCTSGKALKKPLRKNGG